MKNNKHARERKGQLKRDRRLRLIAAKGSCFLFDGETHHNLKWTDLKERNYGYLYKHTSCLCSCIICKSGGYNRTKQKKENIFEMNIES